ncbi:streptococcal hemagglutinin isoform X3 [Drosophila virilis]
MEESLLCSDSDFGNANRRLRTRIDAEIEIRLPAGIEDLRKWTSSEALGDVTVTPDCMHHVETSICTSLSFGDNGVLTPALSPSVLSADAADALYALNISQTADGAHQHHHHHHHLQQQQLLIPNDINKDVPLNHRLPSPEEQTKIIALKYPAEVISVNTSGKHFQRMCAARKSTTGCYAGGAGTATPSSGSPEDNQTEANNLDDNVQTVSRRSRSRKVRGKRRNTIAGIDQKEIQDAANGNADSKHPSNATSPAPAATVDTTKKSKKFGRSKSSDILKKESVALPYDKGKSTLTRLNSLKQWGRNRFKFMQRNGELSGVGESSQLDTSGCSSQNSSTEKPEPSHGHGHGHSVPAPSANAGLKSKRDATRDIDDECVVHELIAKKSESRFSHERKPSYSSSEKSMSVSSSGQLRGKLQLSSLAASSAAHVKMRETATLNRQRRNGLHRMDAAGKEEQPHSSSGNWSASSESGRASIGSEITMQPKSSASNTSLNVSSFQPCSSSGPPSSMLSRRRFLNTSASSSVTSEGTATPELQGDAGGYPNHLDDETSSAYSCDTEGYYTSFHMDSGLRTLKEEEPPMTPLQQSLHTSSYSFGSQSNQTVLNAENEYELYGRGSTSTTTSSAGTVCTTLMNVAVCTGPDVPERSSSLGKHSQSHSNSNSASSSTLERSYSSSTIGSTLERTGTIKRNVKLSAKTEDAVQQQQQQLQQQHHAEDGASRSAQPLPADLEYSECSDLEGVERIERIKQKTAINAKRIPSMCIITPTTSDDDEHQSQDAERTLTSLQLDVDTESDVPEQLTPTNNGSSSSSSRDHNLNELKHTPTKALGGMLEKLRVVLPAAIKRSPGKSCSPPKPAAASAVDDDKLYDLAGEYVTIADISNNNNNNRNNNNNNRQHNRAKNNLAIYYSNDIVRRVAPEQAANQQQPSEYVSLNELPQHLRRHAASGGSKSEACAEQPAVAAAAAGSGNPAGAGGLSGESGVPMYAEISELREEKSLISPSGGQRRVRTTAEGRIIYDSDSLKRRKGAHTTFAPGPYVKETESALLSATRDATGESATAAAAAAATTKSAKLLLLNGGIAANRKVANVRPILAKSPLSKMTAYQPGSSYQEQKQLLANNTNPFYETITTPVATAGMMPSPSSKSNSSTGSTATSSSSATTTASASSAEEGKNLRTATQQQQQEQQQQLQQQQPEQQQLPHQQQQQLNASCSDFVNVTALTHPNQILAIVNNTLLHSTTTTTTTFNNNNNNNNSHSNLLLSKSKFASMSSISCVQPIPPTACGTQVRVAATPSTNPQFSPHIKSAPVPAPPPPLPPRTKVNGIAEAAIRTPTPSPPPPVDLATAAVLSIDPIAETQFSISNATAPKPSPNPTLSPTQSKCRSVALKRNNSYRLANDELKLEMNKENCLSSTPPYGALPPMLHATSSLKLRNLSNMQLVSTTPNAGCPAERKIAKSFERLVDEFSLSTTTCIDSSYLKNKSLENFDDSPALHTTSMPDEGEQPDNDTACDSEEDGEEEEADELVAPHMQLPPTPHSRYHKSFVESVLLRPFKIILPNEDNGARRQRLLQKFEVTEIW